MPSARGGGPVAPLSAEGALAPVITSTLSVDGAGTACTDAALKVHANAGIMASLQVLQSAPLSCTTTRDSRPLNPFQLRRPTNPDSTNTTIDTPDQLRAHASAAAPIWYC